MKSTGKRFLLLVVAVILVVATWWIGGRITAGSRRLTLHHLTVDDGVSEVTPWFSGEDRGLPTQQVGVRADSMAGAGLHIRILTWNIAHGRGDVREGWLKNWKGGNQEDRITRLYAIADLIRRVAPDVVVLNEVDFRAQWSHGLNQAETLARAAGYPFWVEQRNYDIHLPFVAYSFGNALLSRLPIEGVEWIPIPPFSTVESLVLGAKSSAVVWLSGAFGSVGVVPTHLEVRSRKTRMSALPAFHALESREPRPLVLAGDFNSAPSGWPGFSGQTALDSLMLLGWRSPRAQGAPGPEELTFPSDAPRDARDWVLVEPPVEVSRVQVLDIAGGLSDHLPVLAVVALPPDSLGEAGG